LRPLEAEDVVKLKEWRDDYEVFKFLGGGFMPVSLSQFRTWITTMVDNTGNTKRFAITDLEGKHIGVIGLYSINWINRTAELGMYIGDPEFRGKGYGCDAAACLLRFAKRVLNLRKVKLEVVESNVAAVKLYRNLGFREVGIFLEDRFIDGKFENVLAMELKL
jgi:RimJ/RimL family protein N-acetyltransferase